jgi:hypothetical protein
MGQFRAYSDMRPTKQVRGIVMTYGEYPSRVDHQDAVYEAYLLLQYCKGYTAGGFVIPK